MSSKVRTLGRPTTITPKAESGGASIIGLLGIVGKPSHSLTAAMAEELSIANERNSITNSAATSPKLFGNESCPCYNIAMILVRYDSWRVLA